MRTKASPIRCVTQPSIPQHAAPTSLPDLERQQAAELTQLLLQQEATHLVGSARGPTGDLDSSTGELDSLTVSSRLFDSFLSRPASLPAGGAVSLSENGATPGSGQGLTATPCVTRGASRPAAAHGNAQQNRGEVTCKKACSRLLHLTGVGFQVSVNIVVPHINVVQESGDSAA